MPLRPLAGVAALGLPVFPVRKCIETVYPLLGTDDHTAAVAAVSPVRSSSGHVLFPSEANAPVAPPPGFHEDLNFVNEHFFTVAKWQSDRVAK